jgi:hypothetical protein
MPAGPDGVRAERGAMGEAGWTALAGAVPGVAYLATMAPTVYGLDSAELTTGAYVLGIVHAPGSPTYMLLGHLFAQLPVGDVGYRLNLMSALSAAFAALFLYRCIARLTGDRALALAATWFGAFTYYFWISALAAELYALHAAFVSGILLLSLRWREEGAPPTLYLLALLFGLGAGNHLSMALLLPGFLWLVATGRRSPFRPWPVPLLTMLCGLAGAAVYLYLPLRYASDAPLNYARDYWNVDLTSRSGFVWMVSARMFDSFLFAVPPRRLPAELATYAGRLWSNFVGLGVVLGVAGLLGDARRRPSLHIGLALLFGAHLAFYALYGVADKELMLLPTYVIWTVWVAIGAQQLCAVLARSAPDWGVSPAIPLFFLAAGCLVVNFSRVDVSDDWSARRRGERILGAVDRDAVFLGTWSDVPVVEYLQIVEGRRPDVRSVNLFFTPGAGARIARRNLRQGRSVYTSAPGMLDDGALGFESHDGCGCYQVRLLPAALAQ